MNLESRCPPVLSCEQARELEQSLFGRNETSEWKAMTSAGHAIATAVRRDFEEIGGFAADGRILVLVGKGHNGGDALIAARVILDAVPGSTADIVFAFGERVLRPLAWRAWHELVHAAGTRVRVRNSTVTDASMRYELCLDGIFGFQFRPPVDPRVSALIASVNDQPVRLRAAVDLPSANIFRADFTYATGSVKSPLLGNEVAGRLRYLDFGFFAPTAGAKSFGDAATDRVLTREILEPLRALRPARCDKRNFGHVYLIGGSRSYPGAILMSAMAAIRSGAGLVTAFVPESLAAAFATRLPEAIWVGWPETPDGGLALEGEHLLRARIERADSLVIGPGLGRDPETLALAASIAGTSAVPLVIDADALQVDIVGSGNVSRVLTPHAGEFARIAGDADLRTFSRDPRMTVVLKGPVTQICDGGTVFHSFFGGPVLARGGSGDLLAGILGTQLAQLPRDPLRAAARATVWHGMAADALARAHGQVAVQTTQVLDYLAVALEKSRATPPSV